MEHYFRHEYGRLVAMLARRVGVRHIEFVEDAVQSAFMAALTVWTEETPRDNPSAWLYKVAYNRLIQDLRQQSGRQKILERATGELRHRGRWNCLAVLWAIFSTAGSLV